MKVRISWTSKGKAYHSKVCEKYDLERGIGVNWVKVYDLTDKQYNELETAEKSEILIRTKL